MSRFFASSHHYKNLRKGEIEREEGRDRQGERGRISMLKKTVKVSWFSKDKKMGPLVFVISIQKDIFYIDTPVLLDRLYFIQPVINL